MPELPEVETVKNSIKNLLENNIISQVRVISSNLRIKVPSDLAARIENKKIHKAERRAKYINIYLDNDIILVIHLGMTGKISTHAKEPELTKHDHFVIKFSSGDYLVFNDARKFGLVTYLLDSNLNNSKLFHHLGIEPLSDEFSAKYLHEICKKSQIEIKKFIMEQKNVVGVGNIYAAEALFLSAIHPARKSSDLSLSDCKKLVKNIKIVLEAAIEKGGSTIKDYQHADGSSGYFQHEFKVYGRENKPCKTCDSPIKKIVQGGRSTFYCAKCQKK